MSDSNALFGKFRDRPVPGLIIRALCWILLSSRSRSESAGKGTSPKPQTNVDPVAPANATEMDVAQLFTPSGPVQEESLFAGRRQQVDRLVETRSHPSMP